jgi:glycosyltransferase involved in cell wall biosynthesis
MRCEKSDISVVIPYHNREQYIDEAIQSVLAQTLEPLEIIIVNDCSRESSRRYLDRYAGTCTIVDLPVNVGLAAARNEGIRRAKGSLIALLDDDDIWLPDKLAIQQRYLDENPACDAVQSAAWAFFTHKPDELWGFDRPSPLTLAAALTGECTVIPASLVARKELFQRLGSFDERFRLHEERDFEIRLAAAGYRLQAIPEPLVRFRRQSHGNLSSRWINRLVWDAKLFWKHRALYSRAYGWRGTVNYIASGLYRAGKYVRIIGGIFQLVGGALKSEWRTRPGYRDPVLTGTD